MIKPIETQYKGYRFRSRLEAKWAVFFDNINLDWEYELEGVDLGKDGYYLPDFYFNELNLWCEIKGKLTWIESQSSLIPGGIYKSSPEIMLMRSFRDRSNAICLIEGSPGKERIRLFAFDMGESSAGSFDDDYCTWITWAGKPTLKLNYDGNHCVYSDECFQNRLMVSKFEDRYSKDAIENAIRAARSARFEHGENPCPAIH